MGASRATKLRGTNSENPPVSIYIISCRRRRSGGGGGERRRRKK